MTKININFAPKSPITLNKARMIVAATVLLSVLAIVYQLNHLGRVEDEIKNIDIQLETLRKRHNQLKRVSVTLPDYNVLEELDRKTQLVNKLVPHVGGNTLSVLDIIERNLPKNVLLTGFVHKPELGEIDLAVKSQDTVELTSFVHSLEANDSFKQVLIRRQSHGKGDKEDTLYDIRIIQ